MATDANLVLQTSATVTTSTNSTGVDLKVGTPRRGLNARVLYTAAANASGSNTVTFTIEHSDDNSTYYLVSSGASQVLTLSTTAQQGELFIPFITEKRYVRLVTTIAGAGTSPTITRSADISLTHP